ncbi:hypothetical protein [Kribbella sp. NPDC004536]|uniref:hypothetical protein n=1 Tax=Kribbella sp. NPDC004536 TaxID=3364106 RepID=UPI0036C3ED71
MTAIAALLTPVGVGVTHVASGTDPAPTTPVVSFDRIETTQPGTGEMEAEGHVKPAPPDHTVAILQKWDAVHAEWTTVQRGESIGGHILFHLALPGTAGAFRLFSAAGGTDTESASSSKFLDHFVWRGGFMKPLIASSSGEGSLFVRKDGTQDLLLDHQPLDSTRVGKTFEAIYTPDLSTCTQAQATILFRPDAGGSPATTLIVHKPNLPDQQVTIDASHHLLAINFEPNADLIVRGTVLNNNQNRFDLSLTALCDS